MIQVVSLKSKLKMFSDHWAPKIFSTYNGNDLMVATLQGEFMRHAHPDTDDFFLALQGNLIIELMARSGHILLVFDKWLEGGKRN